MLLVLLPVVLRTLRFGLTNNMFSLGLLAFVFFLNQYKLVTVRVSLEL